MKLTRKRAIEMAVRAEICIEPCERCAAGARGVDYGIVLGLQMAAKVFVRYGNYDGQDMLNTTAARRLKKLEKVK